MEFQKACLIYNAQYEGFHLYLFELAFINQFYSRTTGLFQQSLATD